MSEERKRITLREFKLVLSDRLRDPTLSPSDFTKLAIMAPKVFNWKRKPRNVGLSALYAQVGKLELKQREKRELQ